ncbi:MAG: RagB/SusD family nutrient uptake outer membrane protein [Flavobacteriales bacterium]|nr:RagB/SusD family nutrient uptake outer membrane protein [Flavobacteriales bacterium]
MKKYIYIIGVLIFSLSSCTKDYLVTTPTDAASASDALSTPANMMVVLNGVHRNMYAQSSVSGYTNAGESYIMPMLDFPASDALHSTTGNGWFLGTLRWIRHTNPNAGDMEWVWSHFYQITMTVNNIINAAEGMPEEELLDQVLGEAYAYRAYTHFNLVRLWGRDYLHGNPSTDPGIPIMLVTKAPYEGQKRNTVKEVYDQILKDLDASIAYFENASKRDHKSDINIDVVKGIAARVNLAIGNWDEAAKYANEARQDYRLMNHDDIKIGFNSIKIPEIMWGGEVVADQTNYFRAWFYYIGTNFNGSQNRGNPKFINHKLYAKISDTDVRKDLWVEKAPNVIDGFENDPNYTDEDAFWAANKAIKDEYKMANGHKTYPFMSVKFLNSTGATIDPDDVLYMRAAEMYLIEAEGLAQQGKDGEASQVLFDLVSTRDDSYANSTNTGSELIEEIKVHRRIELWGEGFRWYDMLRYDEELDREGTGADPTLYQDGYKQAKPSVNPKWLYQIPQSEINSNPNISISDQN